MIVDDNQKNLTLLATILKEHKYKIGLAKDGNQALHAITSSLPDLVLLDVNMPGMDGYQVCNALKKNEATKNIPVIFITAQNDVEAEKKHLKPERWIS